MTGPEITDSLMADIQRAMKYEGTDKVHPYRRPKDAATLMLIDRTRPTPHVLLGRRHQRHAFMPGKFVFPGGRVELADRYVRPAAPLNMHTEAHLMKRTLRPSALKARALALAAVRETFEETGILLGTKVATTSPAGKLVAASAWKRFADAGVVPDLAGVSFVARAITPPGRPRRFDTRFFTVDASCIAAQVDGMVGEHSELVELVWMPIGDTQSLDLPGITRQVLRELQFRIDAGFGADLPVPFFRIRGPRANRDLL